MSLKARSRADILLAGTGSTAEEPSTRVVVLLMVGLIRAFA